MKLRGRFWLGGAGVGGLIAIFMVGSALGVAAANTDGTTDSSFGTSGTSFIAQAAFPGQNAYFPPGYSGTDDGRTLADRGTAIAVQGDDKVVQVGTISWQGNGSGTDFQSDIGISRTNSDGSIDTGFGSGGTAYLAVAGKWLGATGVALQSDGKIVISGYETDSSTNNEVMLVARFNSNGSIDTSFGSGGVVTTGFTGSGGDNTTGVGVESDGTIVVAGNGYNGVGELAAFNSNGSAESSFGAAGQVATDPASLPGASSGDNSNFSGMTIQSNGAIVVVGSISYNTAGMQDMLVMRYNSDGSLDSSFGSGGAVVTTGGQFPSGYNYSQSTAANAVSLQGDGKIVVAGSNNGKMVLARYNSNGALDTGFNSSGTFKFGAWESVYPVGVAVQTDGKIVVDGAAQNAAYIVTGRVTSDGSYDPSFGNDVAGTSTSFGVDQNSPSDFTCTPGPCGTNGETFAPTVPAGLGLLSNGEMVVGGSYQGLFVGPPFTTEAQVCAVVQCVVHGDPEFFLMKYLSTAVVTPPTGGPPANVTATSSVNPSVSGQSVTFSTTVSSGSGPAPTGTVTFNNNGTDITGCINLSLDGSGGASCTVSLNAAVSPAGILVTYSGDSNYQTTSNFVNQTVNLADTSTALVSGTNPSGSTENVTFTATVTANTPGVGTPTGFVNFYRGGTQISCAGSGGTVTSGVATCTTSLLSSGSPYAITAAYQGDGNFNPSTSGTVNQVVETLVQVTSVTPGLGDETGGEAVYLGGAGFTGATEVTFGGVPGTGLTVTDDNDITVIAPAGAGTVDVRVVTPQMTSAINSSDRFTYVPAGSAPVVTGLTVYSGSVSGGTQIFIQGIRLTGATEVDFGSVACTLSSGCIDWNYDDTELGVLTPPGTGTVDITVITPAGTSAISSNDLYTYTADSGAPATAAVASSAIPSVAGETVALTATVSGGSGTATGTVGFVADNVSIPGCLAVPLNGSGVATCTTNSLVVASSGIPVKAVYTGDATYAGATSAPITQAINPASTHTTVSSSINPAPPNTEITYTANVAVVAPGSGAPAGTVTFLDNGTPISTCTNVNFTGVGVAVCDPSYGSSGNHDITAEYSGDSSYGGSGGSGSGINQDVTTNPVISGISPTTGSGAGSTPVVITGINFTGTSAVSFGGTQATSFNVDSNTQITAISPGGSGTIDITVTNGSGTSATGSSDQFTYLAAAPTVSEVSPGTGGLTAGNSVTITGTGFTGATAVHFGSVAAGSFTVVSGTEITATAPASSTVKGVDVTVTTPGGTSAVNRGVLNMSGVTASASSTFSGSFTPGDAIDGSLTTMWSSAENGSDGQWLAFDFGSAITTDRWVVVSRFDASNGSANGTPQNYDIQTSADGAHWTTVTTSADASTWPAGPAAQYGATLLGQTDFVATTSRYWRILAHGAFDGAHYAEYYEVQASDPTNSDMYGFVEAAPSISGIAPNSGAVAGGTTVTIDGAGFTGATAVSFGTVPASSFSVINDGEIQATTPAPSGGAGPVAVLVTTPGGTTSGGGGQVSMSGVTATASTTQNGSYLPQYSTDGNMNTAWISANPTTDGQWIEFDFGGAMTLNQWVIYARASANQNSGYGEGAPNTYDVQYSTDGSNWTTATTSSVSTSWPAGPIGIFADPTIVGTTDFTATSARYWRLLGHGQYENAQYTTYDEVQAFNVPSTNLFDYSNAPSTSANGNVTATITAGNLAITNMGDGAVSAHLPASMATGALPAADFADATGSGSGWKVTVQATAFHGARGADIASGFFLDSGSSAAITPVGATNTALPGGALPSFVSDGTSDILGSTPVKFLSAAENTGMGTYYGVENVVLDLSPSVYAQVYTSTVTFTILTAP